jgi:hypothetical protein
MPYEQQATSKPFWQRLVGWINFPIVALVNTVFFICFIPAMIIRGLVSAPFKPSWPRRGPDTFERNIARAKALFAEIAERHGLRLEWDDQAPVEAAARLPKQQGLDFSLWLNLQNNDEIGIQSDLFTFSWFPFDDPEKEAMFVASVDGLITGEVRLLCFRGSYYSKPFKVQLQRLVEGTWMTFCTYRYGCFAGWPIRETIIVNHRNRRQTG